MKEIAEDIQEGIKEVKYISRATISGFRDREVWVEVDPERLNSYDLSLDQVTNSIAMKNLNLPGVP